MIRFNHSCELLSVAFVILYIFAVRSCDVVSIRSEAFFSGTHLLFQQLSIEEHIELYAELKKDEATGYYDSGRATFISQANEHTPKMYLFHTQTPDAKAGIGRWVIGDVFGSKDLARAFIDSWAVAPYLTSSASDGNSRETNLWHVPDSQGEWGHDPSFQLTCFQTNDRTLYFESSPVYQPALAGFYVERRSDNPLLPPGTLYSLVTPPLGREDNQFFMFRLPGSSKNRWMIGTVYGQDMGVVFGDIDGDDVAALVGAAADLPPHRTAWKFISPARSGDWVMDPHAIVISKSTVFHGQTGAVHSSLVEMKEEEVSENGNVIIFDDVYQALRFARAVKTLPGTQVHSTLRNKIPFPFIGLGTGGIYLEQSLEVFINALKVGYRLFDLAREYRNEAIMQQALSAVSGASLLKREEVFLETKVWPTELGFFPTIDAVSLSLQELRSNYVDLNLLHWPSCNPAISWMHCETTVDRSGTWRESWRAFEKEYAEGRIMSIGVSNFDHRLLMEMESTALVLPHVVQNFAEPGRVDMEVRRWCSINQAVYQPYASLRNLNSLPAEYAAVLQQVAERRKVSPHAVALRFFLQSGAACIPRSTKLEHLQENFDVVNWELDPAEMTALGWTINTE